jgi:predicted nucleotidyltransferase
MRSYDKIARMDTSVLPNTSQLQTLASKHQLQLIVLFGSAARGTMREESDLDIGIQSKKKLSHAQRLSLWSDLSGLFDRDVDLTVLNYPNPVLDFEIAKEGLLLFEAEENVWENWKSFRVRHYWDTEKFRVDLRQFVSRRAEEMRHAFIE